MIAMRDVDGGGRGQQRWAVGEVVEGGRWWFKLNTR